MRFGRAASICLALGLISAVVLSACSNEAYSDAPKGDLASSPRLSAAAETFPTPAGPAGTRTTKVLVIGIDGAGLDAIRAANTPNLDALMAGGTTSRSYRYGTASAELTQEAATVSGPGWSTVLTGVWPDKHGVRDNSFAGKRFDSWPDFLTRAERLDAKLSTFAVADWDPIATSSAGGPIISSRVDVRIGMRSDSDGIGYVANDERTTDLSVRHLRANGPDLSFVYLGKTDGAGHAHGSNSPAYRASLEADDAQIGRLLSAIRARPTYPRERWQVFVVNDHGHTLQGGHGGNTLLEREDLLIAFGPGIPAGARRDDLNATDVVATAYQHLGFGLPAGLDGTPVSAVVPDAFDSVRSRLQGAVDEAGIPQAVRGWTHTPPSGWFVNNQRMPSGGVTEWRGWTFTTDPFWTSAAPGQGRENFVRGRGVFAVADSDEWDDRTHAAGAFDSTLVSPSYNVSGRSRVTLSFESHYQQENAQMGTVLVAFDSKAPQVVRSYSEHTSGLQTIPVTVPSGSKSMRVRFRYQGSNNWYWAIDKVTVR